MPSLIAASTILRMAVPPAHVVLAARLEGLHGAHCHKKSRMRHAWRETTRLALRWNNTIANLNASNRAHRKAVEKVKAKKTGL